MSNGIATIQVKRQRGIVTVQGLGRTNRGQKFIKGNTGLSAVSFADPKFKGELLVAVKEMLGEKPSPEL